MLADLTAMQRQLGMGACAPDQLMKAQEVPPSPAKVGNLAAGVGAILASLVRLATNVARVDEMLAQLEDSAPTAAEALKWHEIAVRSLAWSRASLVEQQSVILRELGTLAQDPPPGIKTESSWDRSTTAGSDQNTEPEGETSADSAGESDSSDRPLALAPLDVRRHWTPESAQEHVGSLSANIAELQKYGAGRCLLVRRIKPLGLEQPRRLAEHFGRWGTVTDVLVAHSYEKPTARRRHGRLRPASLGFVIMSSEGEASAVVGAGRHVVGGDPAPCEVDVQAYDPHVRRPDGRLVLPEA